MTKILVGYPLFGRDVPVEFCQSMVGLRHPPNVQVDMTPQAGRHVGACRNALAKHALSEGYSHLLMVDVDMSYPHQTLVELYQEGVDVVCGFAVTRYPPHWPVFGPPGKARWTYLAAWPTDTYRTQGKLLHGLQPTGIIGGAAALIKTSVFEQLPEPWFRHEERYTGPNGESIEVGEDAYFSQSCRDAGIELFCRTDLLVGHCHGISLQPRWEPLDAESPMIGRWRTNLIGTGTFYDGPTDEQLDKEEFAVLPAAERPVVERS